MSERTAKRVKDMGWRGHATLYALSHPMEWEEYCPDTEEYVSKPCDHCIVSAVVAMFSGPETYIFPADAGSAESCEPLNWTELPGSFRGRMDHARALRNAGYEIVG